MKTRIDNLNENIYNIKTGNKYVKNDLPDT